MSKIWFTSDTHFYHTNIIKYCNRPFATVEEMNEEMVRRWNVVVAPDDIVYHLGDFSLARRPIELFLNRLNGTKHLIMGNHDHCHKAHAKSVEKSKRMEQWYLDQGFASVQYELKMQIAGHSVKLHHMPYAGDHSEERYTKYRPKDEGGWLLHGHIHEKWKIKGRMINVGVDVHNFYPVNYEEIERIINGNSKT